SPKSPKNTTPVIHFPYCTQNGSPIPYRCRSASTNAGSTVSPCASSACICVVRKSPGGSWMMKKATIEIAIRVGIAFSRRSPMKRSTRGLLPVRRSVGVVELLGLGNAFATVVEGQLRLVGADVLQLGVDDHRLEREIHQPDHVDVLVVLLRDLLAGGDPFLVVRRGAQPLPVGEQPLELLGRLDPVLAAGVVPQAVPGRSEEH